MLQNSKHTLNAFLENSTETVPSICSLIPTLCHQCKAKFVPFLNYSFHPHSDGELYAMRLLCPARNPKGIPRVSLSLLPTASIMFHMWRMGLVCREVEDAPEARCLRVLQQDTGFPVLQWTSFIILNSFCGFPVSWKYCWSNPSF